MPARRCRVTVGPDLDGLSHQVEVDAETMYEAAVAGLEKLQRDDWTPPWVTDVTPIAVTLPDTGVTHTLRVRSIKAWLQRTAGSPREVLQRRKLRERLAARGLTL